MNGLEQVAAFGLMFVVLSVIIGLFGLLVDRLAEAWIWWRFRKIEKEMTRELEAMLVASRGRASLLPTDVAISLGHARMLGGRKNTQRN